jgi:hypothetical protein
MYFAKTALFMGDCSSSSSNFGRKGYSNGHLPKAFYSSPLHQDLAPVETKRPSSTPRLSKTLF